MATSSLCNQTQPLLIEKQEIPKFRIDYNYVGRNSWYVEQQSRTKTRSSSDNSYRNLNFHQSMKSIQIDLYWSDSCVAEFCYGSMEKTICQ